VQEELLPWSNPLIFERFNPRIPIPLHPLIRGSRSSRIGTAFKPTAIAAVSTTIRAAQRLGKYMPSKKHSLSY